MVNTTQTSNGSRPPEIELKWSIRVAEAPEAHQHIPSVSQKAFQLHRCMRL